MAIYLPYSLFPILIFDLLDAMATMCEIWGMGIYAVISYSGGERTPFL